MQSCFCSLSGTAACRHCTNNPNAEMPPTIRTYTVAATDKVLLSNSKQTNADRIRNASEEEIAEFICHQIDDCSKCIGTELCTPQDGRANGLVKWLRQEAKE